VVDKICCGGKKLIAIDLAKVMRDCWGYRTVLRSYLSFWVWLESVRGRTLRPWWLAPLPFQTATYKAPLYKNICIVLNIQVLSCVRYFTPVFRPLAVSLGLYRLRNVLLSSCCFPHAFVVFLVKLPRFFVFLFPPPLSNVATPRFRMKYIVFIRIFCFINFQ
jgi:hypothetical protein